MVNQGSQATDSVFDRAKASGELEHHQLFQKLILLFLLLLLKIKNGAYSSF